jgi:hypothetical protein
MIGPMDPARRFVLRRFALIACLAAALPHARAAPSVREQCDALTRAAVAMARELLRNHGEFAPYGLGLSAGDEVVDLADSMPPDGPRDTGEALRARLADALKARAVDATAFVYEATLTAPPPGQRGDAIAIQLAHRDGYRAVIVVPYRFQDGDVVLGTAQVIEQKGPLPRARNRRKPLSP